MKDTHLSDRSTVSNSAQRPYGIRQAWQCALACVLITVLMLGGIESTTHAQDDSGGPPFRVTVRVDSAFVHVVPALDAERVASAFEDEILEVVGRSLDGTWFEVRRPGRMTNTGWVFNEMLDWDFPPEQLPLTDLTTGLEGPSALDKDPGFAVHMLSGAVLRTGPLLDAARAGTVPRGVTVPVLARNQNGSWLYVNYIGYQGWIVAFAGRDLPDVKAIPEAPNLPPLATIDVVIIPPEVQRAQLERMRGFVLPRRDLAENLASFWTLVERGEVMPCNPPPEITAFQYVENDVRELPEVARYAPQVNDAVTYLNASLGTLRRCGVLAVEDMRQARADAINARILFEATLERLDSLDEIIGQ